MWNKRTFLFLEGNKQKGRLRSVNVSTGRGHNQRHCLKNGGPRDPTRSRAMRAPRGVTASRRHGGGGVTLVTTRSRPCRPRGAQPASQRGTKGPRGAPWPPHAEREECHVSTLGPRGLQQWQRLQPRHRPRKTRDTFSHLVRHRMNDVKRRGPDKSPLL